MKCGRGSSLSNKAVSSQQSALLRFDGTGNWMLATVPTANTSGHENSGGTLNNILFVKDPRGRALLKDDPLWVRSEQSDIT